MQHLLFLLSCRSLVRPIVRSFWTDLTTTGFFGGYGHSTGRNWPPLPNADAATAVFVAVTQPEETAARRDRETTYRVTWEICPRG